METIKVNDKSYRFVKGYRNNASVRESLNKLTMKVYGFDFVDWYESGYWGDGYIPYSLLDGDSVITNISVSTMEMVFEGRTLNCLQIGTVMTDPEYRNQGLNRALLDKVLQEWRGKCDLIYLFANNTVLDFYPKFGFEPVQEYQYTRKVDVEPKGEDLVQLDMNLETDVEFAMSRVKSSTTSHYLTMINNPGLVYFWLRFVYLNNVFYLKKYDAIVVMARDGETLELKEIFSNKSISMEELLPYLVTRNTREVALGFTPEDKSKWQEVELHPDDVLFIMDDNYGLCQDNRFMFPVLSHA